jgi:hypothetical protein
MTTNTELLLLALLSEARDLIAEAMDAHIYDAASGEAPDADCGYADFLQRVERVLAREQPQERQPFTVVATYATPSGRCGRWEGRVLATADTVYAVAEAALRRQRKIGGKMDMQAFGRDEATQRMAPVRA